LARHQFAANRSQPAKDGITQPVAKKLAATGAGIRRTSFHGSPISNSFRHPEKIGLPSFAQALAFFGLFYRGCERAETRK
jgi:hypothetical protein